MRFTSRNGQDTDNFENATSPRRPHATDMGVIIINWGNKIANFEFLPYISFIVAFIASECIKSYWENICGESK